MIQKEHAKLLRDIKRYINQLGESNIGFTEFFTESSYWSEQNKQLPCYQITRKGCEFIVNKITGRKGTEFTARYINRFHDMENIITGQQSQKKQKPWYIKRFRGRDIVLYRDFKELTGIDPKPYAFYTRPISCRLIGGRDFNGWGWRCDREEFTREYGFDYGEDDCMRYLTMCGYAKLMRFIKEEKPSGYIMGKELPDVYVAPDTVKSPVKAVDMPAPIQLSITINGTQVDVSATV